MENSNGERAFCAVFISFALVFGFVVAGMQIKYGVRTAACINQNLTPQDCANWDHLWNALD